MNNRRRNRLKEAANPEKIGWRPHEWADAVGVCRGTVYNLLADGSISAVKLGAARVITTTPTEFLARLAGDAA